MMTMRCSNPILVAQYLLLLLLLANVVHAKELNYPCWVENPMDNGSLGQLGVAQKMTMGLAAVDLSRLRALDALCVSHGKVCESAALQAALDTGKLFNQEVFFATFDSKVGAIYAYAGFNKPNHALCPRAKCNINQCDPVWLCNPTNGEHIGLLGVSYRATDINRQHTAAIDNALTQAEFLYGADVVASKSLIKSLSAAGSTRYLAESHRIDVGEANFTPFRILHQCRQQSTLFSQVEVDFPAPKESIYTVEDIRWIKNPKSQNLDGAVGSVEYSVASGLASDQIELAIRRAIVQLAFEQGAKITERQLSLSRGSGGFIYVSEISESTKVTLRVRVKRIYFQQPSGQTLKVHVWVVNIAEP